MSIAVALERLAAELERMGPWAYVLTVSDQGRSHLVATGMRWEGDELVATVGHRTIANASERPLVTLVWPPAEEGGHSLIVDGTARVVPLPGGRDGRILVTPTWAVWHRPAPPADSAASCDPAPAAGPVPTDACGPIQGP